MTENNNVYEISDKLQFVVPMDDFSEIFHMKHIESDWKPWTEMATKRCDNVTKQYSNYSMLKWAKFWDHFFSDLRHFPPFPIFAHVHTMSQYTHGFI